MGNGQLRIDNGPRTILRFVELMMVVLSSFRSSLLPSMIESASVAVRYPVLRSRSIQYSVSLASLSAIASL